MINEAKPQKDLIASSTSQPVVARSVPQYRHPLNIQPMDQQDADPLPQEAEADSAPLTIDQEMQDDAAREATSASEGLSLAALVRPARRQQIGEIDTLIGKHSARTSLRAATDFAFEVDARRTLLVHRLAQLPNAVGANSYLTEHAHNTAQSQFVWPKQRNFVTLYASNQRKLEGE